MAAFIVFKDESDLEFHVNPSKAYKERLIETSLQKGVDHIQLDGHELERAQEILMLHNIPWTNEGNGRHVHTIKSIKSIRLILLEW